MKHRIVVIGGGSAGITVAARLSRKGETDIAVVEPSDKHHYQPLWTLIGGGQSTPAQAVRSEASVMPKGVTWIRKSATAFDPDNNAVTLHDGSQVEYDALVVCPGIQLDWNEMRGLSDTLGEDGVSSNYRVDLAPVTWKFIKGLTSGTAVFTMPSGPIKCAGAPQKIAYLAADHWRRTGVLGKIDVHMVLPTPRTFGIPAIADQLDKVVSRYGIHLHLQSEVTSIDASSKAVTITSTSGEPETTLNYDIAHVVPRQSAPDWIKSSPLSTGDAKGYVDIDRASMQHVRYPNVFALGDAGSTPNSKTGAAVRKQAPVVVDNLLAYLSGRPMSSSYDGYASCPIVTSDHEMLLAEFDYDLNLKPSFPLIDQVKPRRDMWFLKKYGLPFIYWNLMLRGRA